MKYIKNICIPLCAIGLLSVNPVFAICSGDFYVVVLDADTSPDLRVRSNLVDAAGATDLLGRVSLPDSALGGINTIYMADFLTHAYINNAKVTITTDDTDCVISTHGEFLGVISDVQSSDF